MTLKVAWISDFNIHSGVGGAEQNDKAVYEEGVRRGHHMTLLTPETAPQDPRALLDRDLAVVSNASRFTAAFPVGLGDAGVPYLFFAHDYWPACFPPGELVWRNDRLAPIETVKPGDTTFANGKPMPVKHVMSRPFRGHLAVIKGTGLPPFKATPNHPVLVYPGNEVKKWKRECTVRRYNLKNGIADVPPRPFHVQARWTPAGEIRPGDYIAVPRVQQQWGDRYIDLDAHTLLKANRADKPSRIQLDEDMATFLGWYAAEGSATEAISLGLGPHEEKEAKWLTQFIETRFRASVQVYRHEADSKYGAGIVVQFACRPLARFLKQEFGPRAIEKRMPWWLLGAPPGILKAFMKAYLQGDGHKQRVRGKISLSTSSEEMAHGAALAYVTLGLHPTVDEVAPSESVIRGKVVRNTGGFNIGAAGPDISVIGGEWNRHHATPHHVAMDDSVIIRVRGVGTEPYDGLVYNLEVEGDHVYTAPLALTHNCSYRLFYPRVSICQKCPPNKSHTEKILSRSLLNVFLSPLHIEAWSWQQEKVRSWPHFLHPSPVSGDVFRPGLAERRPGTALCVQSLTGFKGAENVLKYAREHPELQFIFAGEPEEKYAAQVPANGQIVGRLSQEQLAALYAQCEYFVHLPASASPYDRTVSEARLSGCKLVLNKLVGAASWPEFALPRDEYAKWLAGAPARWWEKVEGVA